MFVIQRHVHVLDGLAPLLNWLRCTVHTLRLKIYLFLPRVHLSPQLDYITETTYTEVFQARHAGPTQSPLQAIQGFQDNG
jgi:hypothetical protein